MEMTLKSLTAATVILAAVMATGAASAADLAVRYNALPPGPPPPLTYNWAGFYVGVNAGVGVATTHLTTDPSDIIGNGNGDSTDNATAGFTGGGQIGFNLQFAPNWVLGLEGDIGILSTNKTNCDIDDCTRGDFLNFTSKSDFLVTLRPRFGYAWDRSLLYMTGGGAWVRVNDSWTDFVPAGVNSGSTTLDGWTVGGGLETALLQNVTLKAEYLFVDVGTNQVVDGDGDGSFIDFRHQYHVFRLGLNYRFGGPTGW